MPGLPGFGEIHATMCGNLIEDAKKIKQKQKTKNTKQKPKEGEEKAKGPKRSGPGEGERIWQSLAPLTAGSKGPLKMQIQIQPQKFPSLHHLFDAFYTRTGLKEVFCESYSISEAEV